MQGGLKGAERQSFWAFKASPWFHKALFGWMASKHMFVGVRDTSRGEEKQRSSCVREMSPGPDSRRAIGLKTGFRVYGFRV